MNKLIIDTDPGIDDAQAIAFALAHPEIDLLGLTTVFGNASVDTTSNNALLLLELFGSPGIPVARGAAVPLKREPGDFPEFVHGADGLGNLNCPKPKGELEALNAAEFIVEQTTSLPNEITLVAVGPLTNIALAVRLDPELPKRVRALVVMGGTVNEPGNVTPLAEANFFNDPDAADEVLRHDWPVTVVGLDVTHSVWLRDSDLAQLRDNGGPTGRFLWDSSRFYVNFYSKKGAGAELSEPSCAMHDASAVVFVVTPDSFVCTSGPARVISDGMAAGQLAVDQKGYQYALSDWDHRPRTRVTMQVDANHVRDVFMSTLLGST